jgi:hypothetical protein
MSAKSERKARIKAEKQSEHAARLPERIAAEESERIYNTKVRYPRATDLQLPYVPEHARDEVRNLLGPFVGKIPVKSGNCWWTAQTFVHFADTPRVRYVEGVWTRSPESDLYIPEVNHDAAPHGWNLVDGYPVCLTGEFYAYRQPDDDKWLYEPLNDYSVQEVRTALEGEAGEDYYDTTTVRLKVEQHQLVRVIE